MKRQIIVLSLLYRVLSAESDDLLSDLPRYTNAITAVNQIQGHKNFTLHLVFDQNHPISVYAPQSFQESQEQQIHRFILPNTQMACDTACDCLQDDENNIEIVLHGTMLLNVVGDNFILMTVGQE